MYSSFYSDPDEAGQSYGGIRYDKLQLVRVQSGLDGMTADGESVTLSRNASGRASEMNTFHFTLNAICRSHTYGTQFDGAECAIITSLDDACKGGGNIPSNILPADTYFHADTDGKMRLPRAIVIAPEGVAVATGLEPFVRTYVRGNTAQETMENRDNEIRAVMRELDAPMRDVTSRTWLRSDGGEFSPSKESSDNLQARYAKNGAKISSDLHMHAPDGEWSRMLGGFARDLDEYKSGVRKRPDRYEITEYMEDVMERRIENMREFISERLQENAPVNAMAFYNKGVEQAVQSWTMARQAEPALSSAPAAYKR